MGTRLIDTATNKVVASATGDAYTPELEKGFTAMTVALGNERKRANAERHIARLKMSADSIDKLERRVAGMRAAHSAELSTLAATVGTLDGYSVAYDGTRDAGAVLVPTALVAPEDAS